MRQSSLFTKTRKEAPKDEVSKNASLLIRGGFVHKEAAGVYSFLPLGLRVLEKISNIIREEMDAIGGQEILMSSLQDKNIWETTNRWDDSVVDVWFKTTLKSGAVMGLGFTHEEPLTRLMTNHINSYKDLPVYPYQIQNKFRNEVRAKSGVMRGREFIMKDLYSFSRTNEEHNEFYEKSKIAYMNVFDRVGLGGTTYITFASGGVFAKYSHEFQTISDAGEDIIYVDEDKKIAINEEVYTDKVISDLGLSKESLIEKKSIEVGNIFSLGTKFSEPLGLNYVDEDGKTKPVVMGSYGLGPTRVMGTIVESLSDEKGIVWPKSVSPFDVHIIDLGNKNEEVKKHAEEVYQELKSKGVSVLLDDRNTGAGEKFADSDLIGIPTRIVISEKTMQAGNVEVKYRSSGETVMISEREYIDGLVAEPANNLSAINRNKLAG
ncbi:prolyl-tRNA synthetase [Candidatus Wolfebacteria bacterium]|nr:MAG: prolyl-tRNA synthetase [Candidatus Wolfebacteria bacterium]